jgi:DUF1009 family protein
MEHRTRPVAVDSDAPLGLIAGQGELPRAVALGARAAGRRLAIVALRGFGDPGLRSLGERFRECGVARLGAWIRFFRRAGCREVVMVGRVRKADMYAMPRWRQWLIYLPDLTSIRVWYHRARDKRNDALLGAVADEMQRRGLTMIDSTRYIPEVLAAEGVLTACEPSRQVLNDAEFAWPIAREIGRLDIGQSVAVKEREIIAVEAIEGTDALIARAGELCPAGGWTLVKLAKPAQDPRFDVPTVGPETIENLRRARAAGLVVEAGRTILLERERTIALANQYRIAILGRRSEDRPAVAGD